MLKFPFLSAALAAILLTLTTGCSNDQSPLALPSLSPSPSTSPDSASPVKPKSPSPSILPVALPQKDTFDDATDAAESAASISQSARVKDDWDLVVSRWQDAINLMKAVPKDSKNYAVAQKKLTEYQTNLAYAVKKSALPASSSTTGTPKSVSAPNSIPPFSQGTLTQRKSTPSPKPSPKQSPSPQSAESPKQSPSPQSSASSNPVSTTPKPPSSAPSTSSTTKKK